MRQQRIQSPFADRDYIEELIFNTIIEHQEEIVRLRKSLYGLESAGRLYNKFIVAWALRCGFIQLRTHECIYVCTETQFLSFRSLSTLWEITLFVDVKDSYSDNSSDAACMWFYQKCDSTFKS